MELNSSSKTYTIFWELVDREFGLYIGYSRRRIKHFGVSCATCVGFCAATFRDQRF